MTTLKYTSGRQGSSLDSILCMKFSPSHHQFLWEPWTEAASKVTVPAKPKAPTRVRETGLYPGRGCCHFMIQHEKSLELSLGSDSASGISVEVNKVTTTMLPIDWVRVLGC